MSAPPAPASAAHARRPRLMIVGPLPPPIGGVETFTQAILESPALAAFDVRHCDTTKGRAKSTQGRFDPGNLVWAARHFLRLQRALAAFHPDVVYLPIAGTWSGVLRDLTLGWIAKRSGARVIGHQHDGDIESVLARRGRDEAIVRSGFAQFDRLLVLGEYWRRRFAAYGIPMPCEICPSTFRREVFERGAAARPPRSPSGMIALHVGQIGRRKGVFDLLRALRQLRDEHLPVRLVAVGPTERPGELDAALALRAELKLEDVVEFTGPLQGEALYRHYESANCFVLPSYIEGLPVVLHEAGAFSLPVITTPVGTIPELVRDGENGLLVAPGNIEQIAGAIRRLASDAALRERLGRQLRADVAAFHPDRVSERIARAVWDTLGPAWKG